MVGGFTVSPGAGWCVIEKRRHTELISGLFLHDEREKMYVTVRGTASVRV